MYEDLVGRVIDTSLEEFQDFPPSLDGEIYIGGDAESGWRAKPNLSFARLKSKKAQEIKDAFRREFQIRTFESSLGFPVDNRRYEEKFDKDNVVSLISIGADSVNFKDANGNTHSLTQEDLILLKDEMIADGFAIYQHKWELEALLDEATEEDDLKEIVW